MQPPAAPLDILVVAPHPDDAEISVGGTILHCKDEGLAVGIVELTNGEPTPHGTPELRAAETAAATEVLGVDWRFNLGLPNRSLENTLDARRELASVFRICRPQIVLAPYWEDSHPDHIAASRLCDAARFWSKLSRTDLPGEPWLPPMILYYWSIHLRIHPSPSFVLDVTDFIDRKMEAIRCYESQVATGRSDAFPTLLDDIRDRARYWGWTIQTGYGEPLLSREELKLPGLRTLII